MRNPTPKGALNILLFLKNKLCARWRAHDLNMIPGQMKGGATTLPLASSLFTLKGGVAPPPS